MSKLTGNEVTLALATAAILLISAGLLGTIMSSAQTSSSQAITSNNATNTTNTAAAGGGGGGNNAAVDSGNDTMISSMHRICSPAENNGTEAAAATRMSNNTANTGATNASDGTMQGRPNPTNTTSATAGNNTTSPQEGNLTAIGETLRQARIDLLEGCNAVNNADNNSALTQLNLVARALNNIEGNLTSIMATGGDNTATNAPPTGGTSASSVESATTAEPSDP
jgi:hypothetical protein